MTERVDVIWLIVGLDLGNKCLRSHDSSLSSVVGIQNLSGTHHSQWLKRCQLNSANYGNLWSAADGVTLKYVANNDNLWSAADGVTLKYVANDGNL